MPPLTTSGASALVAGGGISESMEDGMRQQTASAEPQTLKVKAVRSFYYNGKAVPVDAEIELPRLFAREMEAAKKAEIVKATAPSPAAQPKAETKAESKTDAKAEIKSAGAKSGNLV